MLFVWLGFLKEDAEADQNVQRQVTDFLQQPYIQIQSAGALRDKAGNRAGMLMIFDVADRAAAEALVANSPYLQAGLYEAHHLFAYDNEVG